MQEWLTGGIEHPFEGGDLADGAHALGSSTLPSTPKRPLVSIKQRLVTLASDQLEGASRGRN